MLFILIVFLFFNIPSVHAETAEEHLIDGNYDLKVGNLDHAIIDLTRAIEANPNYAKAYNNRGVAYAQEGSFDRAIADFTMAIANNLKDADAYNNRGHAYEQKGNLTQAIFDYTKAIELNAFYEKAYNNREVAYYKLKEYGKAWADVHTAAAIGATADPDFIKELKKASGKEK